MIQYAWTEDLGSDEPFMISAEDQCWDDDTLRQLRDEYNIFFMAAGDAVTPVMIVNKDSKYPLFVLGHEDDGRIQFRRRYGQYEMSFSPRWAKCLIKDLQGALDSLEDNP